MPARLYPCSSSRAGPATKGEFGDPWGLVAMDLVSGRRATARVQVTGPIVALALERA